MIEQGIYQWVEQNPALQELLPSTNSLYMGMVPESASYPCIMFEKVSSVNDTTLDGPSGYRIRRYQFSCYGKDDPNSPGSGYVSAQTLADVLRQQLDGLVTILPDGTRLFNTILDNELDVYSDDEQFIAIQDYFFHFQQI